jgi:hypothetical protein
LYAKSFNMCSSAAKPRGIQKVTLAEYRHK